MTEKAPLGELGGKYRILAELGQGGTARVWLAVARGPSDFNKLVVLKSMKPELIDEPELARMFMNEARLAARLNHPNIVQTNEVFEHEGRPVIVMEYLDGQPLSGVLSRDRQEPSFPLAMQLRVLSEVLGGLHAAHELTDFDGTHLSVVHRDVSPHNVFVTYDGLVKLLDFGIATLVGMGNHTESGVIKGKLHYMSPEQITAAPTDRRADVYACGVVLWEMAAGQRMWRGLNEAVIMHRILNGDLPRISSVNPEVDPYLQELVDRATAFDPEKRYAEATDFQLDLDEYLITTDPALRPRDIGSAVARMFADRRRERAAIVEEQLSRVTSLTDDEYQGEEPLRLLALEQQAEQSKTIMQKEAPSFRALLPWVVIGLLLAAVLFLLVQSPPLPPAPVVVRPAAPAKTTPTETTAAKLVRVRVTAFPAHARVYLDQQELVSNPHLGTYAYDKKTPHVVTASAPGHASLHRQVVFSEDRDIVLTLEKQREEVKPKPPKVATSKATRPKRPSKPSPRPKTAPASSAAVEASPAETPAEDCDPPYYFDDRGIKKYKPECL